MISSDAVCVDLEASVKLEELLNQVFPDISGCRFCCSLVRSVCFD